MAKNSLAVLIMATLSEAKPFIQGLNLLQLEGTPFPAFQNRKLVLAVSGIGKVNAAMATAYSCLTFHPAVVCNLGAAGATDQTAALGDAFQISKIFELDRPTLRNFQPHTHQPDRLNDVKTLHIATQDRPILLPDERNEIAQFAQLVDMEAAAVVQVCKQFGVKCLVFKFVSDTPDHTRGSDILANIKQYRSAFYSFFLRKVLPQLQVQ